MTLILIVKNQNNARKGSHPWFLLSPKTQSYVVGAAIINPTLQMRKLRHWEVEGVAAPGLKACVL